VFEIQRGPREKGRVRFEQDRVTDRFGLVRHKSQPGFETRFRAEAVGDQARLSFRVRRRETLKIGERADEPDQRRGVRQFGAADREWSGSMIHSFRSNKMFKPLIGLRAVNVTSASL